MFSELKRVTRMSREMPGKRNRACPLNEMKADTNSNDCMQTGLRILARIIAREVIREQNRSIERKENCISPNSEGAQINESGLTMTRAFVNEFL